LLPGPQYPTDPTLFAFANKSVWRSTDNAATFMRWDDARLQGLDYTNAMGAAAVSGTLADGSYRLVIGTANGQVWVLDPTQLTWEPASAGTQPPSPLAAATPDAAVGVVSPLPTATALPSPTATSVGATGTITAGTITTGATPGTVTPEAVTPEGTPAPAAEPLTGEPPEGLFRPEGSTSPIWQNNPRAQQDLGWARQATANTVNGAYQRFDNGAMLWREDTRQIYVFFNDGTWRSFADTFAEGDPESDPALAPPGGKLQPIRGFGKVWRDNEEVRAQLGWATAKETAQKGDVHNFARGAILRFGPLLFITLGVDTDRGTWY
jgi:serine/threonine-protein kinase